MVFSECVYIMEGSGSVRVYYSCVVGSIMQDTDEDVQYFASQALSNPHP
jgi:hypothetical protein